MVLNNKKGIGELTMKKHELALNKSKKEVNIRIWGMIGPDDAKSFVEDFTALVSTIQTSEYTLSFDANELKVSIQAMLPMLESCFKMYKDLGFKKVIIKIENNVTLRMQIKRIAKTTGLDIEMV